MIDAERAITWSRDGTLALIDIRLGTVRRVFSGHTERVEGVAPLSSGRILSWSFDGFLRVWDVETGRNLATMRPINRARLGPFGEHPSWVKPLKGNQLLTEYSSGMFRLWDPTQGKLLQTLTEDEALRYRPEWYAYHTKLPAQANCVVYGGSAQIGLTLEEPAVGSVVLWHAESDVQARLERLP